MTARLLLSLSGVSPASLDDCLRLTAELDARGVRTSLLVAPRTRGPLDWLRERHRGGDAILLHGYDRTTGPRRLRAGVERLADVGLHTDAFAAPRWLASPGTVRALRRTGFAVCADVTGVRDLRVGLVHRGRVLGFGGTGEPWWCRAMVLGAARAARRGGLVRLAVDATDLGRSGRRGAVLDAVDIALHHGARPTTYAA